jgi:hypothetical protein
MAAALRVYSRDRGMQVGWLCRARSSQRLLRWLLVPEILARLWRNGKLVLLHEPGESIRDAPGHLGIGACRARARVHLP